MRLLKVTCFLMLCGCETSLLGEWNGTCIFADANQESLVEVTKRLKETMAISSKALWISYLGR